jgi:Ca-activated chloride channel homolog
MRRILVCTCLPLLSQVGLAAATGLDNSVTTPPWFRGESALVLVPVSVIDRSGGPVVTLSEKNFQLTDNGRRQKVSYFWKDDAPLSVAIIVDLSSRMSGKVDGERHAVSQFLSYARHDDEFCLIELQDRPKLVKDFGVAPQAILNELQEAQTGGHTALADGIDLALQQMKKGHNPRKALLVISDGGDNRSRISFRKVKELALESDTAIYAVEPPVTANMWAPEGKGLLHDLANSTGGRDYLVEGPKQISGAVDKIGTELRGQYVLGYIPAPKKPDGKYHRLGVKVVALAKRTKVTSYWRRGYYALKD